MDESHLNAGLFTYPVLQAADILLYKYGLPRYAVILILKLTVIRATHVPVGEDQQQHIELCRDIAENFNRAYQGAYFPLPEYMISMYTSLRRLWSRRPDEVFIAPTPRVLSLKDPTSKMSKSAPDQNSRILLTDPFDRIKAKIRGAVTDSTVGITYDPEGRPGAANLLTILSACTGENIESVAARYHDKGHGHLKTDVTEAVEEMLRGPRTEFERLKDEKEYLDEVARAGAAQARELSKATMKRVRTTLGLV